MKVKELIEYLEEFEPEAEVFIMSQEHYPFENNIQWVTSRESIIERAEMNESGEYRDEAEEEDQEELKKIQDSYRGSTSRRRDAYSDLELPPDDVFIVEGSQIRYGSKYAW